MVVAPYPLLGAECRFSLGSRVLVWGAWVPWCRAGWACSWCAARRGGCGIIRVDRALRVDPVPPGVPDPPGRPFPPRCLRALGREGHRGRQGRAGAGRRGGSGVASLAAASPAAAGRRPRGHDRAHGVCGSRRAGLTPVTWPAPLAPAAGACAPDAAGWPHRPAGPAATDHTVTVASITRRRAELAGWLRDLSNTPLANCFP